VKTFLMGKVLSSLRRKGEKLTQNSNFFYYYNQSKLKVPSSIFQTTAGLLFHGT